jgi:ubiquinone/menaquinone biosynthesis C-methylase UbiE
MSEAGSYDASSMPGGLEQELERLRLQALLPWPKESRTLAQFGLRDGMSLLELGGGPGYVTQQLLEMLPNGQVTVVERDPVLIERAANYLKGKGDEHLRIIEGSVMDMPLPDSSFDFAFGRLVFQHLPDPVGAAKEALRVLKPGGKLVIDDIDDRLHTFEPVAEPQVEAIYERFRREQASKGGNRFIGRRLPRILQEAGFRNIQIEAILDHSDVLGLENLLPKGSPDDWKPLLEEGKITEQEMQLLIAADERFYSSDPIAMLFILMACGEKP